MKIAINIQPLNSGHKQRGIGYYTGNLLTYLKKEKDLEILEFNKLSEVKKVELIHYPWFDFYFHTLPIVRRFKTVVTIHDTIPLIFPSHYPAGIKGKINLLLQKLALRNVDAIISDSLASKKDIIKYLKIEERKIIVIPLAEDSNFRLLKDTELIRAKRKYNLPGRFLLYVGDANWVKNLPFLVNGFRLLVKNPDFKELKLVLIGGVFLKNVENIDHPELDSLRELNRLIKNYHLEDQILRPGHVDSKDLVAFYNLATIYVQPSLYEGFGLPLLEAMACGTPVVSSGRGSLPEVGGKAAVYFDPTNLNQFIVVIKEILQDKSLQNKLSKSGFEQVNKFSWEKTASRTQEVYKKIIQP